MSRAFVWISAFLVGLAGCKAPDDASAMSAALPAASAPKAATSNAPEPAQPADMRCVKLKDWQAAGKHTFTFSDATAANADDESGPSTYNVHFSVTRDGNKAQGSLAINDFDPSGIVLDEADIPNWTTVCAGHIFIVNLAAERGGVLVLGNLQAGTLAMSTLFYSSTDEDTATFALKDGVLVVTDAEGSVRLQEVAEPDADFPAHSLVPESMTCTREDPEGRSVLKLLPDTEGNIRAFEYLSIMPGGASCSVEGNAEAGATLTRRDGGTDIVWEDEDDASHGARMRITRSGETYRLAVERYYHPIFCGQSAQLADRISLRRGTTACTAVEWPK